MLQLEKTEVYLISIVFFRAFQLCIEIENSNNMVYANDMFTKKRNFISRSEYVQIDLLSGEDWGPLNINGPSKKSLAS